MIESLLAGFKIAPQPEMFLVTVLAVLRGLVVGSLLGLTATMAGAVLLPLTFDMPPQEGLIILVTVFIAAVQGGSIPAVLINTPGTPAATATTFDGYPLARKGLAGKAIGIAMIASFIGLIISWLLLITLAPLIARVALTFSTPEYFAIAVFGLTIISTLSSDSPLKGLIAGLFGFLIATIGLDPIDGIPRFTFGADVLLGGISYVPALIGLFAVTEVFWSVEELGLGREIRQKIRKVLPTLREIKTVLGTSIRSGLIGSGIGALPGAGADIAAFVGYGEAKRWARRSEEFGNGRIEGVAGAEAANNAVCGSALIPLLTLGIPGGCRHRYHSWGFHYPRAQAGAEPFRRSRGYRLHGVRRVFRGSRAHVDRGAFPGQSVCQDPQCIEKNSSAGHSVALPRWGLCHTKFHIRCLRDRIFRHFRLPDSQVRLSRQSDRAGVDTRADGRV